MATNQATKKLTLNKETLRNLKTKTGVKAGDTWITAAGCPVSLHCKTGTCPI